MSGRLPSQVFQLFFSIIVFPFTFFLRIFARFWDAALLIFKRPPLKLYHSVTLAETAAEPREKLRRARTYAEWQSAALLLDVQLEKLPWRSRERSSNYDYKLIRMRMQKMAGQRASKSDVSELMATFRCGLIRNFGGITNPRLYENCYSGTKKLIEDYIQECLRCINAIKESKLCGKSDKFNFFLGCQQALGTTALFLEGGATIGLFHFGVVKALHASRVLPRVICGSAVGALIAAIACVHDDQKLDEILAKNGIDISPFENVGQSGSMRRKLIRLFKYGHPLDKAVLEECVRGNIGDVTFEEAYAKTNRVLNIVVSRDSQLLNHLTSPNVLIWTAACVSLASVYPLYQQIMLLARQPNGLVTQWSTRAWHAAAPYQPPRHERAAYHSEQIAGSFGVNHIIVSQAGALVAPLVLREWRVAYPRTAALAAAIFRETRRRIDLLARMRLIPRALANWISPETVSGDVTVAPHLSRTDYLNIMRNPTVADIAHWITRGERSTYPVISSIRTRCDVEFALDTSRIACGRGRQMPYMASSSFLPLTSSSKLLKVLLEESHCA